MTRLSIRAAWLATLSTVALATAAQAGTVDLSSYVNADVRTYTSGADYPTGPISISGVDGAIGFVIAPIGQDGAGVIQLATNDASPNIAVNQTGVDLAYVILNSAFGASGADIGTLTFHGAGADLVSFDIVEGVNIRDHYNGFFNNSATDIYGTADYDGGNRFDAYRFDISALHGTVSSIDFTSTGDAGVPSGEPFLAAVTLGASSAVPEPATWALMIGGLGLAGAMLRRREVRTA